MDKLDFLMQLQTLLRPLSEEDQQRSIDYYAETIDDRMEEGLTEEEAVAAVGDVEEIARSILAETPVPPAPVQPEKKQRRLRWWEIVLLALGFPIWFSLLVAAASVVFSLWVSLWSVVISLYATAVALGASAVGCAFGSFFMVGDGFGIVLVAWGAAFVCAGLTILMFILSNLATKGMVALTKLIVSGIKGIFARKERSA